jgi:hypothetical protein
MAIRPYKPRWSTDLPPAEERLPLICVKQMVGGDPPSPDRCDCHDCT